MSDRQAGFSVVETLMAMIVVGSASLALTQVLITARTMAAESRARSVALQTAQLGLEYSRSTSELAELVPLSRSPNGLWQLEQTTDPRSGLTRYEVRVPWVAGRKRGEVRLVTYDWQEGRDG